MFIPSVYSTVIRTHDLQIMSLIPQQPEQGSRPTFNDIDLRYDNYLSSLLGG